MPLTTDHKTGAPESFMSPRFSTYVAAYLLRRQLDPAPLFQQAGLDYRHGEELVVPIPPSKLQWLLEAVAEFMSDPHIGLSIGGDFAFEFSGLNALIMISSANMEQAMQARIKYDTFINNAIYDRIQTTHGYFTHGFRISTMNTSELRHVHELLAAQLLTVLRTGSGASLSPARVQFEHKAAGERKVYQSHFGTDDILFGAPINSMAYTHATARQPFITANKTLNAVLTRSVKLLLQDQDGNQFTDRVYRELIRLLDAGVPDLEEVAQNLYVSTRTLRRKLKDEGASFQQLKQQAMHKMAMQLLTISNAPLAEIAFQLGYSESSAFVRAFKSWEGITPQKFRERARS